MEPDRKIEKWLRGYAKKRREQSGAPLDLHPATRRMLQGEVARRSKGRPSLSLGMRLRLRWILGLGVALCIVLLAGVSLRFLLPTPEPEHASSLGMASPVPQKSLPLMAANSAQPLAAPGSPQENVNSANRSLTLSGSNQGVSGQGGSRAVPFNHDTFAPSTNALPIMAMNRLERPATVQEPAGSASLSRAASGHIFVLKSDFKKTPSSASAPILKKFEVLPKGNLLRMIDQDGSSYEGELQRENPVFAGGAALALPAPSGQPSNPAPAAAAPFALKPNETYFFRVSGTNQTLQQPIVFTGTLLISRTETRHPETAAKAKDALADALEATANPSLDNQPPKLPPETMRVTGTATIGQTNHLQINATSAATVP